MYKKIKYIIFVILVGAVFSCKQEVGPVLEIVKNPVFISPGNDSSYVLTNDMADDTFAVFSWSEAEYNIPVQVSYTLEVDLKSNDFSDPIEIGTVNNDSIMFTVFDMNVILTTKLGLSVGQASEISFRVGAHGAESEKSYSDVIDLTVTPYNPPYTPDSLFIMSGTTKLKSLALLDDNGNYEGYVWLDDANLSVTVKGSDAEALEFGYSAITDDNPVMIYDLNETGDPITVDSAGYYRFKINMFDQTAEVMGTSWSIIGSAVYPYAWNGDIHLTYLAGEGIWQVSTDTVANGIHDGEFKFRPNETWDPLNYGDDGADGIPDEYGANIAISAGNYTITLDLREYPYSYSVTPIVK